MELLGKTAEEALRIILLCDKSKDDYTIVGKYQIFPPYMNQSYKQIFEEIKSTRLILDYNLWLTGWEVYVTPETSKYFERKGMRRELFDELSENARELLNDLVNAENITILLNERMNKDVTDSLQRGIISELQDNVLINVVWADNLPYHANITNAGRTYFEREEKYVNKIEKNKTTVSIGTLNANGSNFLFGNAINSSLNIDNSIDEIERKIISDGGEDREALQEILEEVKEILRNFESSKTIQPRKSFMKRLSLHMEKNSWFYSSVVTLLGEVSIKLLME